MKKCPQCKRTYTDESFDYCLDDGEVLVYGPGGDGDPATAILDATPGSEDATRVQEVDVSTEAVSSRRWKTLAIASGLVIVISAAGLVAYRSFSGNGQLNISAFSNSQPQIRSLAVLPLKPLDASDNYIGMGIADAIIRRMSQTGQLTVRPTSAIRKYLNDDTDAVTLAKQLNADAILEGSVQRADDRLRVSVNLLRTSDGASLWNDSFDLKMT